MPRVSRRTQVFAYEATKVFAIVLGFYVLQGQIFHVRYDIYGRTSGLAHAQERTSSELGDTQRFLELTAEDVETSQAHLVRTREELARSVEELQAERERILALLDGRAAEVEQRLDSRFRRREEQFEAVRAVAEANAARLRRMSATFDKSPDEMKRRMIFPTVQLRGNGTVGSGVIVYSELQPGLSDGPIHTTFIITAYHVVTEVLQDRLDGVLEEVHVVDDAQPDETRVYRAKLVLFDKAKDIALLRLDTQTRQPYLAALMSAERLASLDVFSPAYAVGCPLGNRPLPTLGEVSSKSKVVADQTFWMLNAPTFFGNSGGGIYSVPSCELIGVSSMIYTYGKSHPTVVPHMGLFVPLAAIYEWLDQQGYGFVHRREPIPTRLRWKLAYIEKGVARPQPAAATAR